MGVGLVCSPGAICTKLTPISGEMEMRVGVILVWTKTHSSAKTWFFSPKYPLSLIKMHCNRNVTQTSTKCLPNVYQTSTKHLPNIYQTSTKHLPNIYQTSTKHNPHCHPRVNPTSKSLLILIVFNILNNWGY